MQHSFIPAAASSGWLPPRWRPSASLAAADGARCRTRHRLPDPPDTLCRAVSSGSGTDTTARMFAKKTAS
ncbi:hypothetical protein ACTMU2_19250 [Cupriavidus basilensis]